MRIRFVHDHETHAKGDEVNIEEARGTALVTLGVATEVPPEPGTGGIGDFGVLDHLVEVIRADPDKAE
jgi:hypothetical protein